MTNESKLNTLYPAVKGIEALFGSPGLIVLSYWLGALSTSQIKKEIGFFPALNLTGQPGSGKSTLCEILHALMGMPDYEGLSSSVTTAALYHQATKRTTTPLVIININDDIDSDDKTSNLIRHFFTGSQYTRAPILSSDSSIGFCPEVKARTVLVNLEPSKNHASCLSEEMFLHATMNAPHFSLGGDITKSLFLERAISKFSLYSKKIESCNRKVGQNYALLAAMTDSLGFVFDAQAESIERAVQSIAQTAKSTVA